MSMRSYVFARTHPKVFLALFFHAVCLFVYRFKWILSSLRHECNFFFKSLAESAIEFVEALPEPQELFRWRNLRKLIPSPQTVVIYLITFGVVLPLLSMGLTNTLYQYFLDSNRYTEMSSVIKQIARGPNLTQQVVDENTERLRQSISILDRLTIDYQNVTHEMKSHSFKDVVIGIITYSRDKYREAGDGDPRQYLTQLTASLLDKYKQYRQVRLEKPIAAPFNERSLSVSLLLCNVDEDPDNHQEFRWLSNRLKVGSISRKEKEKIMNSCEDPSRKVTGMGPWGPFEYNSRYEKQKQDYTFCLKYFQEQMLSRYILVLEDDVLPVKDFFFRLHELVVNRLDRYEYGSTLAKRHHHSLYERPPVFMVKLHHPEVFLGFHNLQPERLPQLAAMATLASLALNTAIRALPLLWVMFRSGNSRGYRTTKRTSPEPVNNDEKSSPNSVSSTFSDVESRSNKECNRNVSATFAFIDYVFAKQFDWFHFAKWFLFFALVFLVIGRPNTYLPILAAINESITAFPHYFMTLIPAPSCCITAVLYPKHSVDEVIQFFDKNRCIQNAEARDDMLFGQLSDSHRLPSILTEPNLFYHIGRYSSIRGRVNTNDDREWAGIPF